MLNVFQLPYLKPSFGHPVHKRRLNHLMTHKCYYLNTAVHFILFRYFSRTTRGFTTNTAHLYTMSNDGTRSQSLDLGARFEGIDVALLSLVEVDDIPNGAEVINLDILVLEIERVFPNINTNDRSV